MLPMSRLTHWAKRVDLSTPTFLASLPTSTSLSSNRTTLGVSTSPSELAIMAVLPESCSQEMAEKVVPRSIPTARLLDMIGERTREFVESDDRRAAGPGGKPMITGYPKGGAMSTWE